MTGGLAQSVLTRLVRHAKVIEADPNLVLARYAVERLLYRLSRSPHANRFVLKGALLMNVWLGETVRATRDADLLGIGDLGAEALTRLFADVCTTAVEPDGLEFDAASIKVAAIRPEHAYGGQRVTMLAHLGSARLRVQVDVGIGDAVVPDPEWLEYPGLLDLPRARIRAYRPETAIAEKVHAMVTLGSGNSRMKDFFDIHALAMHEAFAGATLVDAIRSTFVRRRTDMPSATPLAFTSAFARQQGKQAQWTGFIRRHRAREAPADLEEVVEGLGEFAGPPLAAAGSGSTFTARWEAGGPWRPTGEKSE